MNRTALFFVEREHDCCCLGIGRGELYCSSLSEDVTGSKKCGSSAGVVTSSKLFRPPECLTT